ncbi:MAG: TIGR04086 family membrane protein [Clostridiales bacterium]|nr:TIGR04086 family membrane protein [Clostridiales bacterium]MCD8133860.1 TIGR04086 family membrane protein [Clostridiales bacterium]
MDRSIKKKNKPLIILSTLLIMYVITGLALLALALVLLKLQPEESVINIGIMAIYIISCLLGGLIAGKRIKERKFLWGVLTGAVYFLILLAGSFLLNRGISSDTVHVATTLVMCIAAGMIGGMIS